MVLDKTQDLIFDLIMDLIIKLPTLQSTGNVKPWWKGKYLQPEVSGPGILALENPKLLGRKLKKNKKKSENFKMQIQTNSLRNMNFLFLRYRYPDFLWRISNNVFIRLK